MKKIFLLTIILFSILLIGCSEKQILTEKDINENISIEKTPKIETSTKENKIEEMKKIMANLPPEVEEKMPEEVKRKLQETITNMEQMQKMGMSDMMDDEQMQEMLEMMKIRTGHNNKINVTQGYPKFVKHNFIELDKIDRISKLRSGYGHDFSFRTSEECRSMKHYYWAKGGYPQANHNPKWMSIKYFAPVDGTIYDIQYSEHEYGKEAQFILSSDKQPSFRFYFFHVKLLETITENSKVKAGQQIGTIGHEEAHGEIAVTAETTEGHDLISFLQIVDDNIFTEYQKRGLQNREDIIITREERDANPLECDYSTEAGYFTKRNDRTYQIWAESEANWVFLN